MAEPQFKVGDFVVSRANTEAIRLCALGIQPIVMQVIEIAQVKSSAGTQTSYSCRGGTPQGVMDVMEFMEIELAPAPTAPPLV